MAVAVKFPKVESWNTLREAVFFPAEIDGARIQCAISLAALRDHFGGKLQSPLEIFRANRRRIEAKARERIVLGCFELHGFVPIRSFDGP